MENIEHSWVIQWVGPFYSKNDCEIWVNNNAYEGEYNFYFASGLRQNARRHSFRIGRTMQPRIFDRWNHDIGHSIHEYENRNNCEIWIGRFSDFETRNLESSIKIEYVDHVRHTLISAYCQFNGDDCCIENRNLTDTCPYPICIVNQWYRYDFYLYQNKNHINRNMPDAIFYTDQNSLKISDRLS